jgi:hypothetical protein
MVLVRIYRRPAQSGTEIRPRPAANIAFSARPLPVRAADSIDVSRFPPAIRFRPVARALQAT